MKRQIRSGSLLPGHNGMGNGRAWWNSMPGMSADSTAQLMLVKSEDDGKTWSQPINITPAGERSFLVLPVARTGPGVSR